jgi:hypothetical protein
MSDWKDDLQPFYGSPPVVEMGAVQFTLSRRIASAMQTKQSHPQWAPHPPDSTTELDAELSHSRLPALLSQ